MYINILTEKKNICRSSHSSSFSSNMAANKYTLKTIGDITSWQVTASEGASAATFTVIPATPSNFTSMSLDMLDSSVYNKLTIELSNDYINWYELPYKQQTINGNISIYRFIENSPVSGRVYANISTGELIQEAANMTYCFEYTNPHNLERFLLYKNQLFSFFRITFEFAAGEPNLYTLAFKDLQIWVNEFINDRYLLKNTLSSKVDIFFRSKIFESQPFMPDQVKTFLSMLEKNNSQDDAEGYKHIFLQNSEIKIEDISNANFEGLPTILTIDDASVAPTEAEILGRDIEVGL